MDNSLWLAKDWKGTDFTITSVVPDVSGFTVNLDPKQFNRLFNIRQKSYHMIRRLLKKPYKSNNIKVTLAEKLENDIVIGLVSQTLYLMLILQKIHDFIMEDKNKLPGFNIKSRLTQDQIDRLKSFNTYTKALASDAKSLDNAAESIQNADKGFKNMADVVVKSFDMSNNEPHIMVHCPICLNEWQKKVEEKEFISECDCKLMYSMKKKANRVVIVEFSVSNNMLKDEQH